MGVREPADPQRFHRSLVFRLAVRVCVFHSSFPEMLVEIRQDEPAETRQPLAWVLTRPRLGARQQLRASEPRTVSTRTNPYPKPRHPKQYNENEYLAGPKAAARGCTWVLPDSPSFLVLTPGRRDKKKTSSMSLVRIKPVRLSEDMQHHSHLPTRDDNQTHDPERKRVRAEFQS